MSSNRTRFFLISSLVLAAALFIGASFNSGRRPAKKKHFVLSKNPAATFNSFVDCNMSEVWVADTFRIFPGKYGEDPLWGDSNNLMFADGATIDAAFASKPSDFTVPKMPPNVKPGTPGLHGAVWFESVYQDSNDKSGKTLYALYHNENYPATLPYDAKTGKGYIDAKWPQGLKGLLRQQRYVGLVSCDRTTAVKAGPTKVF